MPRSSISSFIESSSESFIPSSKIYSKVILLPGDRGNSLHSDIRSFKGYFLLIGIKCKINLIPYNEVIVKGRKPNNLRRTSDEKILRFQKVLEDSGVKTIIRKSRGSDISAACGQLRSEN